MSAKDAAEKAKRNFGGFEKWNEVCRDVGRWRLFDELGRDLAWRCGCCGSHRFSLL